MTAKQKRKPLDGCYWIVLQYGHRLRGFETKKEAEAYKSAKWRAVGRGALSVVHWTEVRR